MRTPVTVAVVGLGARGSRLARAFDELESAELRWVFDSHRHPAVRARHGLTRPGTAGSFEELLADEELDAIAIATPLATRFGFARRAIEAGKHVFVEGPAALNTHESEWLAARASADGTRIMVGGEPASHPAARRLREVVSAGGLGEVYYARVERSGIAERRDEGVLWHAGAEAVALILWLVGDEPIEASAHGSAYGSDGPEDVVFGHLRFATGILADVRVSTLEPREERRLTVVASGGMGILDELDAAQPITLYERGGPGDQLGTVVSPMLPRVDVTVARCERFVTEVRSPTATLGFLGEGPSVVAVLRALRRSLELGGDRVPVGTPAVRSRHGDDLPAAVVPLRLHSSRSTP